MKRVTLKHVAEAAGVSVSCAARAIKGRPDIAKATVARVQAAAEELGYRPDPMLASLAAYRQAGRPSAFHGTLAFLNTRYDEPTALGHAEIGQLLRGARERAEALGYRLEYFNIGQERKTQQRAWRVMCARGIGGALLRSFPVPTQEIDLPFEDFACIDLFSEPHLPRISTVSSNHAQSMELVLGKLLERGYRHPALVLRKDLSEYLHHGWWRVFSTNAGQFSRTSTYLHGNAPADFAKLVQWAHTRKVDVLIHCANEGIKSYLDAAGRAALGSIGVVCMDLLDPAVGASGIDQNRPDAGAIALNLLHSMITTSRIGIANLSTAVMVPGKWDEREGTAPGRH